MGGSLLRDGTHGDYVRSPKFFPFYVIANEVRCSDDIPDQYHLFRLFNMGREPQIYILHGSLKILCQLEPVLFRAVI